MCLLTTLRALKLTASSCVTTGIYLLRTGKAAERMIARGFSTSARHFRNRAVGVPPQPRSVVKRLVTVATLIAGGLVFAAALSQTVSAFLFGVRPFDPLTFGGVTLVLIVTALVAMAAPAMRAARVDPIVAFRAE